jgi:hypothetical protein
VKGDQLGSLHGAEDGSDVDWREGLLDSSSDGTEVDSTEGVTEDAADSSALGDEVDEDAGQEVGADNKRRVWSRQADTHKSTSQNIRQTTAGTVKDHDSVHGSASGTRTQPPSPVVVPPPPPPPLPPSVTNILIIP